MKIAMLLYDKVTQLDFTGPQEVLGRLPGAEVAFVAKTRDPVVSETKLAMLPTATFADVTQADLLFVPGGFGQIAATADDETRAVGRAHRRDGEVGDRRRAPARCCSARVASCTAIAPRPTGRTWICLPLVGATADRSARRRRSQPDHERRRDRRHRHGVPGRRRDRRPRGRRGDRAQPRVRPAARAPRPSEQRRCRASSPGSASGSSRATSERRAQLVDGRASPLTTRGRGSRARGGAASCGSTCDRCRPRAPRRRCCRRAARAAARCSGARTR